MNTNTQNASICNQKNWDETVDVNQLKLIKTFPNSTRHYPVNHGNALDLFTNTLCQHNIIPENPRGLLSKDGLKYVYITDIKRPEVKPEYNFSFGFVNFNNCQKSFTIILGEKVFVCSNECFTHQVDDLKRMHSRDILRDLKERMKIGIERYKIFSEERSTEINRLKTRPFGEKELGRTVLQFHREGSFNNTIIDKIIDEYDSPTYLEFAEKTAWNFQNACTHVFKDIRNPVYRMDFQKKMSNIINNSLDITPIDM